MKVRTVILISTILSNARAEEEIIYCEVTADCAFLSEFYVCKPIKQTT